MQLNVLLNEKFVSNTDLDALKNLLTRWGRIILIPSLSQPDGIKEVCEDILGERSS